jgi:hypothetical protein
LKLLASGQAWIKLIKMPMTFDLEVNVSFSGSLSWTKNPKKGKGANRGSI